VSIIFRDDIIKNEVLKMANEYWVDDNIRMNIGISIVGLLFLGVTLYLMMLSASENIDYSTVPTVLHITSGIGLFCFFMAGTIITAFGATQDFSRKVEIKNYIIKR